jgi:hypothetical protein
MDRNKVTLKEALKSYRQRVYSSEEIGAHLSMPELYEIASGLHDSTSNGQVLEHLIGCPKCAEELKEISISIEESYGLDFVSPKIAASPNWQGVIKVSADGGKYTLSLRRNLSNPVNGLITVEANPPYNERFEGKIIRVKDNKKEVILEGTLVKGKVSQKVNKIDDIDLSLFTISIVENDEEESK